MREDGAEARNHAQAHRGNRDSEQQRQRQRRKIERAQPQSACSRSEKGWWWTAEAIGAAQGAAAPAWAGVPCASSAGGGASAGAMGNSSAAGAPTLSIGAAVLCDSAAGPPAARSA